jgi:hypothetical protein
MNFSCRGAEKSVQKFFRAHGQKTVQKTFCRRAMQVLRVWPAELCCRREISTALNREAGNFPCLQKNLLSFVASHELVSFDGGDHTDSAFFARLGALYAAEAADADRSG